MAEYLAVNIRDGTFPETVDLLGQETDATGVSALLRSLTDSKDQLEKEIREVSQTAAGDVDEWISQAKKVQEDIARCKIEARQIVEEYQRGEKLRNTFKDSETQVQLLEMEVAFTKALENEIQSVAEITQVLREAERDLSNEDPVQAARKVVSLKSTIATISATQTRSLMSQLETDLRNSCQKKLEHILGKRWTVKKSKGEDSLTVYSADTMHASSEDATTSISIDEIIDAFQELDVLSSATTVVVSSIDSLIDAMLNLTQPFPSNAEAKGGTLVITKTHTDGDSHIILSVLRRVLEFLHVNLPPRIRDDAAHRFLPKTVSRLISLWLDPALPHDLHDLQKLEPLEKEVSQLAQQLKSYSWPCVGALNDWLEQVPRGWLAKRRVTSLDAIRKAFASATGVLRPVERVERQYIAVSEAEEIAKQQDDWKTSWDDDVEHPDSAAKEKGEEEASGWDFETEDEASSNPQRKSDENLNDEDDSGDAWGWGEDENEVDNTQPPEKSPKLHRRQTNGQKPVPSKTKEIVLTETYHITDIPDYILEVIGKDMADSHELQNSATRYFNTSSPATGLAGLPNLILALFRATAPTYYSLPSATYTLSNMNLYNDTLYVIQRLTESQDASNFETSILSLTRFARQVYSSELDLQRTILTDLLDGAQGFDRCTTFPNSQACVDAVSSTVDRVRQLHKDWSGILGESHLLQSLGLLMTMIFGKFIKDIEDMDDISEAESKQLVTFCQQILGLEDLFSSRLPNLTHGQSLTQEQPGPGSSQVLLYVPNYLRFQYLQQILDSNLVDIKYLWTESELSLEFSVEELVDLIKALFAESEHRRSAIRTIRGSHVGKKPF